MHITMMSYKHDIPNFKALLGFSDSSQNVLYKSNLVGGLVTRVDFLIPGDTTSAGLLAGLLRFGVGGVALGRGGTWWSCGVAGVVLEGILGFGIAAGTEEI
jgi:hypothetical protein